MAENPPDSITQHIFQPAVEPAMREIQQRHRQKDRRAADTAHRRNRHGNEIKGRADKMRFVMLRVTSASTPAVTSRYSHWHKATARSKNAAHT